MAMIGDYEAVGRQDIALTNNGEVLWLYTTTPVAYE